MKQSSAHHPNILHVAFVRHLVVQRPASEPAFVLLERVRAERSAQTSMAKPCVRNKIIQD